MSPELRRRIAFTVGVLPVYRLGTYIPLPGIDLTVWKQLFQRQPAGVSCDGDICPLRRRPRVLVEGALRQSSNMAGRPS